MHALASIMRTGAYTHFCIHNWDPITVCEWIFYTSHHISFIVDAKTVKILRHMLFLIYSIWCQWKSRNSSLLKFKYVNGNFFESQFTQEQTIGHNNISSPANITNVTRAYDQIASPVWSSFSHLPTHWLMNKTSWWIKQKKNLQRCESLNVLRWPLFLHEYRHNE